jgi:hypothetical protein
VLEVVDLITGEKIVVLKKVGSCYNVEVADFITSKMLPSFSFIFTEFESKRFLFHTML